MPDPLDIHDPEEAAARNAELQETRRVAREQELEDIKFVVGTPQGMRVMRRLMAEGKVFSTTFTGNSTGMFLEGQRNLALKFFADIATACAEKIPELIVPPPPAEEKPKSRRG